MAELSAEEKMLLTELHRDPRFASIMEKARSHGAVPAYRPNDEDEAKKKNGWIYKSGYGEGIKFVLVLLGYE